MNRGLVRDKYYSVIFDMPKPYARIAITLPEQDLLAADRLAATHDRSRSWIIAEALRRYVVQLSSEETSERLGPSRQAQLARDLALTPEERVREAEQTALLSDLRERAGRAPPRQFATYDDFLDWQQGRRSIP
jgi:hypothetical protein